MKGHRPELKAIEGGLKNVPVLPETLPGEMAGDWALLAADLIGRGMLDTASLTLLETYVGALWVARSARRAIAEHGVLVRSKDGALRPNPAGAMLAKANEIVARLGYEMGISVAGRNLPNAKAAAAQPSDDDLSRLGV